MTKEDAEDVVNLLEESLLDAFTTSAGVLYGFDGTARPGSRKNGPTRQVQAASFFEMIATNSVCNCS